MAKDTVVTNIIYGLLKKILSVDESNSVDIGEPKKILIVRQHNQLGDLLTDVSLSRAIKEKYPDCHITLIVSPFNYSGLIKNRFIDRLFIFDKTKLYSLSYISTFLKLLREKYDLAIVPVIVSISFTSNLISRISNSKIRIGPESLNGQENKSAFLFDRRVNMDWRKYPDSNVYEKSIDILRPFGITTNNFKTEINFDEEDLAVADSFINQLDFTSGDLLIGLHVGAGKPPNRWALSRYTGLIKKLKYQFNTVLYITGSSADNNEINYLKQNIPFPLGIFLNKKITEVAALISKSDLFICNDTGIMHVAGSTDTPQISIFGPTNPFNWAPIGSNKYFIRKSGLIDDVTVQDVFDLCGNILLKNSERS
ncbi:MAG TPA: lipopolysaccharide heptosyltransferase family protein [Ignavibacteria bacterium]|nr:lipopolysaccharide heptosyltransferase family protein [Ignavibacteria bacterium]